MATLMVTRLAPVTARDGVDTRNQDLTLCPLEVSTGVAMDGRSWGDMMIGHEMPESYAVYVYDYSPEQVDYHVWRDMADEPAKYGDDIDEWLELNDTLSTGPKRWRMDAYWLLRELDQQRDAVRAAECLEEAQREWKALFTPIAKKAAAIAMDRRVNRDIQAFVRRIRNAVVTIQSAVRGWLVRKDMPGMDCCMCLAHAPSPYKTEVGMMCHACALDGPYTDVVPDDPWAWYRAVDDDRVPCRGCSRKVCFPEDEPYCSRGCKYE